jgi:hypothetical protein
MAASGSSIQWSASCSGDLRVSMASQQLANIHSTAAHVAAVGTRAASPQVPGLHTHLWARHWAGS